MEKLIEKRKVLLTQEAHEDLKYLEYVTNDILDGTVSTKMMLMTKPKNILDNKEILDILIGTILGDGSLDKSNKGVYWRFAQGHINRIYLF